MNKKNNLYSIFLRFLRFGFLAWGGPVAQIAMIKDELVDREKWIAPEKFKRTLAVYQALPGSEAHELCVYFGMIKAGRWGGFLAGLGFMLPGFLLMLLLSWLYLFYGSSTLLPLFAGVAPAVCALIFRATHKIGSNILTDKSHFLCAISAIILTLLGVHFLWVFIVCAAFQTLWEIKNKYILIVLFLLLSLGAVFTNQIFPIAQVIKTNGSGSLLIEGLKAGLLSFGGAYTAIPFLQNSMVGNYDHITNQVFLDGIALGSVIPSPLIIFGTYLGFIAGGFYGAILMTIGIFAPAFAFTLLGHKHLERIIENRALHSILDGISAAVVGLLAVTALNIFQTTITDLSKLILFLSALAAFYLIKNRFAIPLVILAFGIFGLAI